MSEANKMTLENGKRLDIHMKLSPAKVTEVYDTYWKFAAKRQEIFFERLIGKSEPWTSDSILNIYKFTNTYRASDRVSQYLIKEVIYNDRLPNSNAEIFFRILLFKLFNKISTWELLRSELDVISYETYDFNTYDHILSEAMLAKERIYSAAYIMPSVGSVFGYPKKHSNHLKLIEMMMQSRAYDRIASSKNMQEAFEIVKSYPGLGDFLAYQLSVDINYSSITNFSESSFVVPGPGAIGGISKCFLDTGGLNNVEIIKFMTDRQEKEFDRLGIDFLDLWGRPLQLIDCQNLFCEVDKYARIKHPDIKGNSQRSRIKQKFKSDLSKIDYWFPPKWEINDNVTSFKDTISTR